MGQRIAPLQIGKGAGAVRQAKIPHRPVKTINSGDGKKNQRKNMQPGGNNRPEIQERQANKQPDDTEKQPSLAPNPFQQEIGPRQQNADFKP